MFNPETAVANVSTFAYPPRLTDEELSDRFPAFHALASEQHGPDERDSAAREMLRHPDFGEWSDARGPGSFISAVTILASLVEPTPEEKFTLAETMGILTAIAAWNATAPGAGKLFIGDPELVQSHWEHLSLLIVAQHNRG